MFWTMSLIRILFKGWSFINDTYLCDTFTYSFFKIYHKIVQLKQILSNLKYFQNGLSLWELEQICYRQENSLKNLEQIVTVAYIHFILFRLHERVIVTKMKYYISIQMVVEQVLTEKSKESTKYIAHVTNII